MNVKQCIKEPLVHFMLVGALIFAVAQWREGRRASAEAATRIDVTAGTIAWLRESFSRQWHRAPDQAQLRVLIDEHLREEVLYREALALGLDRDDAIVRRRMAQKMEFLTQDVSSAVQPDDVQLREFFGANSQRYAKPERISFRHVFFSKDRRGAHLDADVEAALRALGNGADDNQIGDPFLREREFVKADATDVTAALGSEFAARILTFPAGSWRGPVESTYGVHLVLVSERIAAPPIPFEAVHDSVMRDLLDERRLSANRDLVQRLKARYRISIDEAAITANPVPPTAASPTAVSPTASAPTAATGSGG